MAADRLTPLSISDRAQLEKDRLGRQRRRQLVSKQLNATTNLLGLGASDSSSAPSVDVSTDSRDSDNAHSTKQLTHTHYWKHHHSCLSPNHQYSEMPLLDLSSFLVPNITLSSSGDPSANLTLAIVSSPNVDAAWLMKYMPPETVPAILVTASSKPHDFAPHDSAFGSEAALKFLGSNWLQCRPEVESLGKMRANYMLLFYGTSMLRVVITSAHFTEFHWTAIENVIWAQDFPARPEAPSARFPALANRFVSSLLDVMSWQNIPAALLSLSSTGIVPELTSHSVSSLLACYDFAAVEVALVASIPGKHDGWPAAQKVGHTGLMSAVNDINKRCPPGSSLKIEYLTSSLASYSPQWLREFQNSAEGGERHQSFLKMSSKSKQTIPFPDNTSFKIIFPARMGVDSSEGGIKSVLNDDGSLCWKLPTFPGHLLFEAKSKLGVLPMHSKMIIADVGNEESPYSKVKRGGWCYLGSHDLTAAAWGEWLPVSTWFTPSLKISHCALGVVIPFRGQLADTAACFQKPPPPYREADAP